MKSKAPVLILMLLTPVLSAGTCSEDGSNPLEDDEFTAIVDLINNESGDGLPVHIFAPGEGFVPGAPTQCCRVNAGGGTRNVPMNLKPGSSFTFRAGREQVIVDTVTCRVQGSATSDSRFTVQWVHAFNQPIGSHELECVGPGWQL